MTRLNFSPSGKLTSPNPIAATMRNVVATVAEYNSANHKRIMRGFPSCNSRYIITPDVPSATHLSSNPRGTGLRGTYDMCGIPLGGPEAPVHCIIDSSGVTIHPHLNCCFRTLLKPSTSHLTSAQGSVCFTVSVPAGPRARYRRTRWKRSLLRTRPKSGGANMPFHSVAQRSVPLRYCAPIG